MTSSPGRSLAITCLAALGLALLPVGPAAACSCAEPEAAVPVDDEDAALAVVRRLDGGRGGEGRLAVLAEIGTRRLPAVLSAPIDEGSSCELFLVRGGVTAVLATREGDAWTVGACASLGVGPALALDPALAPMVDASAGEPVAVMAGRFGGDLLRTVDAEGRVVAALPGDGAWPALLARCGDEHVLFGRTDVDGVGAAVDVVAIDGLEVVATHELGPGAWPRDATCVMDGDVPATLLVAANGQEGEALLVRVDQPTDAGASPVVRRSIDRDRPPEPIAVVDGGLVVALHGYGSGPTLVRHPDPQGAEQVAEVEAGYVTHAIAEPGGTRLVLSGDSVHVLDRATGDVRLLQAGSVEEPVQHTVVGWVGGDVLVVSNDDERQVARLRRLGADGSVDELGTTTYGHTPGAARGDRLLRAGGVVTTLHDLTTGEARSWGPLWTAAADHVLLLADLALPAQDAFAAEVAGAGVPTTAGPVDAGQPDDGPQEGSPDDDVVATGPEANPGDDELDLPIAAVAAGGVTLAVLAGLAALAVTRRAARRAEP